MVETTKGQQEYPASAVLVADDVTYYPGDTVEEALQQAATDIAAVAAAGEDNILRTGAVDFAADQSMAGFLLTNLGPGTAAGHSVRFEQLGFLLCSICGATVTQIGTASNNMYFPLMGLNYPTATLANVEMVIERASTVRCFRGYVSANNLNQNATFTVMKNGAATSLTATVTAGSGAVTFADTSNSVAFAAGDKISVQVTGIGGATGNASVRRMQVEVVQA